MDYRRGSSAGFTLAELLIVLTIMAMVTALALPSLDRLMNRWRFYLARGDLERQVNRLSEIARLQARGFVLTSSHGATRDRDYPLRLPDGWQIRVDVPIQYRFDGSCSGGSLSIVADGLVAPYVLSPPLCQLQPG